MICLSTAGLRAFIILRCPVNLQEIVLEGRLSIWAWPLERPFFCLWASHGTNVSQDPHMKTPVWMNGWTLRASISCLWICLAPELLQMFQTAESARLYFCAKKLASARSMSTLSGKAPSFHQQSERSEVRPSLKFETTTKTSAWVNIPHTSATSYWQRKLEITVCIL